MSQAQPFKLVTTQPIPDTYKLERRSAPRRPSQGLLTAVCTTEEENGQRYRRITRLQMLNISETGIGAVCDDALPIGTSVAMLIPPHAPDNGFDMFGKVVRCNPTAQGFDIGIALDQAHAACA